LEISKYLHVTKKDNSWKNKKNEIIFFCIQQAGKFMVINLMTLGKCSLSNLYHNRIGGVMISMLASSLLDRGFEPRLGQTKWL